MIRYFDFFPGDPVISSTVWAVLSLCGETGLYLFSLLVLKFYLPGRSPANRALARIVGLIIGVFAAKYQTATFAHFYFLHYRSLGLVFLVFTIINAGITAFVFNDHQNT